jgi:hypothetical protein
MAMKKREVLQLVHAMPEEIDPDDLIYRLYLMQKVEAGEHAAARSDTVSHEEAVRLSDEWPK